MTRQLPVVDLAAVDDDVLAELIAAATTRAIADEVTPPLTPGGDWSPERVAWLRSFHVERRTGLEGPAHEITWAVLVDGGVAGSVRLRRTAEPGTLEVGLWLTRDVRGLGVGTRVLAACLDRARALGATAVRADTTARNRGAVAVLRRHGFTLDDGDGDAIVGVRRWVTD